MSEFQLTIEPESVVFAGSYSSPIEAKLKLTNASDDPKAFKVKCTDNKLFRIRPVVGLLMNRDDAAEVTLTVIADGTKPAKQHYFIVVHVDAEADATCARAVWEAKPGEGTLKRIDAEFTDEPTPTEEANEEPPEE